MNQFQELERIERNIKDLDSRLQTFLYNLSVVEKEHAHLTLLQAQLEENIRILRRIKLTIVLSDFKKAKDDLIRTQIRLNAISSDKEKMDKVCSQTQNMIDKGKEDHAKLLKSLENIVVQGNFGSYDGQGSS